MLADVLADRGWVTVDGTPGRSTLQGMVDWPRADLNNEAFSRVRSGQTARVYVVTCGDHPFIETFVDNTKPDNLRELPSC